jgi:PAS domain S-box-containing protein
MINKMSAQTKIKKAKNYRGLTVTLAIAFIVLSSIVLLITGSLNMYYVFQNQQKTVAAQQGLIAQNAANSVKDFIQGKFNGLGSAVHLGGLGNALQAEGKTTLEKLLGLEPAFRQILLLDPQERVRLKVSRQSNLATTHFDKLAVGNLELQLAQQKYLISSIFIDEASSEPLVWMAIPVIDIFGDTKGIVAAEVNLKFMWDLVVQIRVGESGMAYVVDKKGNLIAFRDISRVLKGENIARLKKVGNFVNNKDSHIENNAEISTGIQGTYSVSNYIALGTPDWAVVVELPVHEAYQTLIHTFVILGLAMLMSFVLTFFIGIYLSRKIVRPLVALRDTTRKISAGDLNTRIKIESRNEIGDLALSFNTMMEDLHATTVSRDALEKEVAEREQAEKSLVESEARFKAIYEGANDALMLLTEKGFFDCNPRTLEMFGFTSKEEFTRVHPADISPPNQPDGTESFPAAQEQIKTAFEHGSNRFEWVHRRTNGEDFFAEVLLTAFDLNGKRVLQATVRDITKRKQAEMGLQQREATLRGIYMAAPVGIAVSGKRIMQTINRQITEISGYEEEELIGKSARIFFADDAEFERVGRELYGDLRKKGRANVETRWKCKNGIQVDILLTSAPVEGAGHEIVTVMDITERKRAEGALTESEKSFRSMFELTSEGVALICPKTGKFIAANPAMCNMFGYTEEEFCALSGEDITPPEAKEIMRHSMQILFNGGAVPDHEGISVRKDGTFVNAIVSCRQMSWKGETVFHVTFKDVTFLKAIQEQLKKKNTEIMEFTDMVTHDLKKPLTTMNIVLGMTKKDAFGALSPDGVEAIDTGIEASHYMQEMLEDLLACARLETGAQELVIEETRFKELADVVLGRLKFQSEEKKIQVVLPEKDISVMADRKQLTRVLMNLVGNAINYIGSGPDKFIRIDWEQRNGVPVFMVADNGIGVPEKSQKDLFAKFKRGSNVSGVQGTGLGLSIVKGIVEVHGGKIWFESEVNKGTTFYFTLAGKEAKS